MKIFVTGIAGFLGSHLADRLLAKGHEVAGCDNLLGGYRENVPKEAEFHEADCEDLAAMQQLTKGAEVVRVESILEYGLRHIPEIATRYAEPLSLKEEFLREYLTVKVDYHMDEACVESLRQFYEMAARIGAIKSARPVEFL